MNTALAIYTAENGAPTTAAQVKKALDENLINADSLIPVTQGYAFYWSKTDNQIVLINGDNKSRLDNGEWVLLSATGYGTLKETADATEIKNAISSSTVQNPAWIKLSGDATISDEMLTVNDTNVVIFDLNEHTLDLQKVGEVGRLDDPNKKAKVSLFVNGGSVTIKNGDVKVNETGRGILNRNGMLALDHVTISGEGCGVFVEGISDTSLTDTTISVVNGYGITSNSSSSSSDGSRISIFGGEIKTTVKEGTEKNSDSDYAAIYIPTFADVTIENCKVSGNGWGAFFRGCNATIKNSTFTHDSYFTENTTYGTSCSGTYGDIMFACGSTAGTFKDYIAVGNYNCENVTANKIIVHEPKGGTVNVSGIEESKITKE